jgi:hypothetical protein
MNKKEPQGIPLTKRPNRLQPRRAAKIILLLQAYTQMLHRATKHKREHFKLRKSIFIELVLKYLQNWYRYRVCQGRSCTVVRHGFGRARYDCLCK